MAEDGTSPNVLKKINAVYSKFAQIDTPAWVQGFHGPLRDERARQGAMMDFLSATSSWKDAKAKYFQYQASIQSSQRR